MKETNKNNKEEQKCEEKEEEKFVKIVYKDKYDNNKESIYTIPDYDYSRSYRENVEEVATGIYDEGGFWSDEDTIIPFHRVLSVEAHKVDKPKKPNKVKKKNSHGGQRRGRPRKNISNDKSSLQDKK